MRSVCCGARHLKRCLGTSVHRHVEKLGPSEVKSAENNGLMAMDQYGQNTTASSYSSMPHSWQAQHPAQGLSAGRFMPETEAILTGPVDPDDVEIRPEGFPYMAVNSYRAILNKAFGPGAWGLQPLGPLITEGDETYREYQLWAHGRPIAQARGETSAVNTVKTAHSSASETVKSDALKRCAKDLGIGIELSKKSWSRQFKADHCLEVWLKNTKGGPSKKIWRRKDAGPYEVFPWAEESIVGQARPAASSAPRPVSDFAASAKSTTNANSTSTATIAPRSPYTRAKYVPAAKS